MKLSVQCVLQAFKEQAVIIQEWQAEPEETDPNVNNFGIMKGLYTCFESLFLKAMKQNCPIFAERIFLHLVKQWPLFEPLKTVAVSKEDSDYEYPNYFNLYHGPIGSLRIELFNFIKETFEKDPEKVMADIQFEISNQSKLYWGKLWEVYHLIFLPSNEESVLQYLKDHRKVNSENDG